MRTYMYATIKHLHTYLQYIPYSSAMIIQGHPAFFQVMMKSFASPTKHCCLADWMGVAISTRF